MLISSVTRLVNYSYNMTQVNSYSASFFYPFIGPPPSPGNCSRLVSRFYDHVKLNKPTMSSMEPNNQLIVPIIDKWPLVLLFHRQIKPNEEKDPHQDDHSLLTCSSRFHIAVNSNMRWIFFFVLLVASEMANETKPRGRTTFLRCYSRIVILNSSNCLYS